MACFVCASHKSRSMKFSLVSRWCTLCFPIHLYDRTDDWSVIDWCHFWRLAQRKWNISLVSFVGSIENGAKCEIASCRPAPYRTRHRGEEAEASAFSLRSVLEVGPGPGKVILHRRGRCQEFQFTPKFLQPVNIVLQLGLTLLCLNISLPFLVCLSLSAPVLAPVHWLPVHFSADSHCLLADLRIEVQSGVCWWT